MSVFPGEPAIQADGLRKNYGRAVALDGADLSVAQGESLALLGPNGSGKSTLLRILATVASPSGGSARIFGLSVADRPREVRRLVGYAPQAPTADVELTCEENLRFMARLFGMGRQERRARIEELLELFQLGEHRNRVAGKLSGGMKRRLELARALIHKPKLLLLDEPAAGLDPPAREALWSLLRRLRSERGLTTLMATHRLEDAVAVCGRAAILSRGRVAEISSLDGVWRPADVHVEAAEEA